MQNAYSVFINILNIKVKREIRPINIWFSIVYKEDKIRYNKYHFIYLVNYRIQIIILEGEEKWKNY